MNEAAKYHIKEMRRAACDEVEAPLIMAESAALLSMYTVIERDFKLYLRVEIVATAVNNSRPKITEAPLKQSMSSAVAVLVSKATRAAVWREECGSTFRLSNIAADPDKRGISHRRRR